MTVWGAGLIALVVTVVAMPPLLFVLRRGDVLDHPNERSSHRHVTVRGAGIAVAIGAIAGIASWNPGQPGRWWLAACAVVFGVVGFLDDVRSLSPKLRLAAQVALSVGSLVVAGVLDQMSSAWFVLAFASFGVIAYVNAFNFMDGINGISGLQALVAGGGLAIAGGMVDAPVVQLGGVAIAAAALGFLPFNAPRAQAFLGDVGSYFIGAWIALLAVLAFDHGAGLACVVGVAIIYAGDTAYTLVRRVLRGEDWWSAHRQHAYQRLTDTGLSHLSVALIVAAFSAAAAGLGLAAIDRPASVATLLIAAEFAVCALYLATPSLVSRARPHL
jgi:UDP-GlcNAc:undecaprenyl-phosphate/decaprenyl-phosphate GlcNAc-1-phosphate transferase